MWQKETVNIFQEDFFICSEFRIIYAAINFMRYHPPGHPGDLHQKFGATAGFLLPNFSPGVGDFLTLFLMGGLISPPKVF